MTDKQRIHAVRVAVAAYQERLHNLQCHHAWAESYWDTAGALASQLAEQVDTIVTLRCDRCGSKYVPCECGTDN